MKNRFHQFDLHVHTPFSDGQISIDKMLQILIELGIKIVGFADHVFPGAFYTHPPNKNLQPSGLVTCYSAEMLHYRKQVFRIYEKKYPKIRILNGAEIDVWPHGGLTLPPGIKSDFFDYLLISKHHTVPKDFGFLFKKFPKTERWLWQHSPRLKLNEYLWEKGLYATFERYHPNVFAHPQEGMPKSIGVLKNRDKMKRFVLMCTKNDVAIELNNLFWDRKKKVSYYEWFYPILEYGHECGTKFSLASDFHGFEKEISFYLNKSQEMVELVETYDLDLIDPHKFLPENK